MYKCVWKYNTYKYHVMNHQRFVLDLDFPELPLDHMPMPPVKAPFLQEDLQPHWYAELIGSAELRPAFVDFLRSINLEPVDNHMIFVTPPNSSSPLHIDSNGEEHNLCYINYAYGCDDHSMAWFEVDPNSTESSEDTYAGILTRFDASRNPKKLHEHHIKFPSLVRIGVPHQVVNHSPVPRYCLSIAVAESHKSPNQIGKYGGVDFDWAVNNLQNFITK